MRTIGESTFMQMAYDEANDLIISSWHGDNEFINLAAIQEHIAFMADIIAQHSAKYILADDRQRHFPYSVEIQEWVANTLVAACLRSGVKKFGIVLPRDMIAALSTEQVNDEKEDVSIDVRFFQDKDTAMAWLLGA